VKQIHGDRNQFNEFEQAMMAARFDVVIDMVCFGPEQAAAAVGRVRRKMPAVSSFVRPPAPTA
jgi:hypothetical protein